MFWISLYAALFVWALLALSAVITLGFKWLLIVAVALSLNVANVVGYTKCQKGMSLSSVQCSASFSSYTDAKRQIASIASRFITSAAARVMSASQESTDGQQQQRQPATTV